MKQLSVSIIAFFALTISFGQAYPEGFAEEVAYEVFTSPAGMLHTDSTYAFVWELSGKVWMIHEGEVFDTPVIDISEEVGFWGDHGMIGAALDPNFFENGYIYLLYNVDRHHLMNYGTPAYDPNASETSTASIGRVTRYTLNTVDFQFAIPDSRLVLVGSEIDNGIPTTAASHGVGQLIFGADGSLLISCGDSNTWVGKNDFEGYNGEGPVPEYGYDDVALADGILTEGEFVGGFRPQYLDGMSGKLLRINPATGEGLSDNPYFSEEAPDSPRSKIWALGFRNPYRMTLRPGTGNESHPGTIFMQDVGDWVWEEINVVYDKGLNFGWPMYQGPIEHYFYNNVETQNSGAPNPLSGSTGCSDMYFDFQDLIQQPNAQHEYSYPNPCNENVSIPDDVLTFQHERPVLAYSNSVIDGSQTVTPSYGSNGQATYISIDNPDGIVSGEPFDGISGSGGVFLQGDQIPEEYQDWFIQGDFSGWLRAFKFNEENELTDVEYWNEYIGAPIHISQDPSDGCIYVVSISPSEIKRICFGGNLRPRAIATPEVVFGTSPIEVTLDGSESYDPEGGPLTYEWTFSDGGSSDLPAVEHTFSSPTNNVTQYEAKLVVTDQEGLTDSLIIPVSLNNTPPVAEIVSFEENELLSIEVPTFGVLTATIEDEEHSESEIDFDWVIYLHHNTHFHRLDEVYGNNSTYTFQPLNCSETEVFWFRLALTATDPGGLSSYDELFLYPDCDGELPSPQFDDKTFIAFPNPTSNNLQIQSSISLSEGITYNIFSPEGKRVATNFIPIFSGLRYFEIDVSYLSQGGYILELETGSVKERLRFVKTLE